MTLYQINDLVRVKSWTELEKEYEKDGPDLYFKDEDICFNHEMIPLCNHEFIIKKAEKGLRSCRKDRDEYALACPEDKVLEMHAGGWTITNSMLELVSERKSFSAEEILTFLL